MGVIFSLFIKKYNIIFNMNNSYKSKKDDDILIEIIDESGKVINSNKNTLIYKD